MRRAILILTLLAAALWSAPSLAQSRAQLGPLCTTDTTPADQQIDACNKIIALKVFTGEKLATIYFWRAVGWNKKGNYTQVIADAGEAIRLHPSVALYNLRGSAYYDKGEDDIAIADFNDALRIGPPSGIIFHNRGNAWRSKGEYAKAIADYDQSIKFGTAIGVFLAEPRHFETRPRRSRWRAGRHQRSDPARPDIAAAPDQPRGDLARQGRPRSRHRRLDRGDPARKSKSAGQHHDAARQRADLGLCSPRARLRGQGRFRPREAGLCRHARRSGLRRRQQGQPGNCEGSPVAIVRDATARAANCNRCTTVGSQQSRAGFAGGCREPVPACRSGAAQARRDRQRDRSGALRS